MKLNEYIKVERKDFRGEVSRIAKFLGVPVANVCEWVNGKRRIPIRHCPVIEFLTNGMVRCEEMRPEVQWWILRTKLAPKKGK